MTDTPTRRTLRWSVPVDDQWHQIGAGKVLHTEVRSRSDVVEVWTLETTGPDWPSQNAVKTRTVRVYGTGQPISEADSEHIGTALTPGGALVWHVFGATR